MVLGLACGLVGGAAWSATDVSPGPAPGDQAVAHRRDPAVGPRRAIVVAPALRAEDRGPVAGGAATGQTARAARVLRGWDRARAEAYAAGSVRSLRELYVDGAGEADVRLLRSYVRRGYRVEDLCMQLLAVHVLRHRPGRWRLRVTDRLAGGAAVGYGERVALPRDRASTRTVVLRRGRTGEWRVVRVRG